MRKSSLPLPAPRRRAARLAVTVTLLASLVPLLPAAEPRPASAAFLGLPRKPVLPRAGNWTAAPAFANVTFRNPVFLEPEPGSRRLFVGELEGRVYAIDEDRPDTQEKQLILDLSAHTQGGWDCGMLGLAFHPEYRRKGSPNQGYIYIFYSWTETPVVIGRPPSDFVTWSRLSRFTVDAATGIADPRSELVLINQRDRFIIHAGGGIFFHPRDGFLYLSVGDEGGPSSPEVPQVIDRSLFSGVLRIDVDQRGGNISHPIPRRPVAGETDHYFIPNDNPFVGVPGALEEFFAIGLRSPHRMTYDAVDNLAWIGEVGQSAVEEISVLEFDRAPLNFQWNLKEGSRPGLRPGDAANTRGIWTDPIFELGRDQARSIIGGFVYRGRRFPSLQGKYICGDFASAKLWALSYTKGAPPKLAQVEVLGETTSINYNYRGGEGGLTSFGLSHDGELYLLHHGLYSHIAQLVHTVPQPGNIPELLSQTRVFDDLVHLVPAAGLVAYDVNLPQWSDEVPARRWISVPAGKKINFSRDGHWTFPVGTVLVQHFEVPAARSPTGGTQRLETRLLVAAEDGTFYGVGYRWQNDQKDARFVATEDSRGFTLRGDETRSRGRSWGLDNPARCAECHNPGAGYVLGVKTRQLHRDIETANGGSGSQLIAWNRLGLIAPPLDSGSVADLPKLAAATDQNASVEQHVRSYLDVYCAHCHGSSPVRAAWDGNLTTPLADQRIVWGPLVGDTAGPGAYVLAPKDVSGSVMHRRAASRDPIDRMPPLGQSQFDPMFVGLLRTWIEELPRDEQDPPQLVRARRRNETSIDVVFSEPVQRGAGENGAERPDNYWLSDGTRVLAAKLGDDLRTVTLTTDATPPAGSLNVTVRNVVDRATKPNPITHDASVVVRK